MFVQQQEIRRNLPSFRRYDSQHTRTEEKEVVKRFFDNLRGGLASLAVLSDFFGGAYERDIIQQFIDQGRRNSTADTGSDSPMQAIQ